jgi:hypothetical protein
VSTFAIPLGPDHFEASTPAAILNAYQSARFDSPIQTCQTRSFVRHVERLTLLDVNLPLGIEAPNCDLMPCALAFFTSQFHACADGTSEETRKGDYKGNERVTLELPRDYLPSAVIRSGCPA